MKQPVFIFGASGHAKVIADIVRAQGSYELEAFVEKSPASQEFLGWPLLQENSVQGPASALIGIGDNWRRWLVAQEIAKRNLSFAIAVHPSAVVAPDVKIGPGTVVMAGAIINPGARIGAHCIINTGASVDHDCVIEDGASLAPRSTLGGNVKIGAFTAVGLGAVVIHGISIGAHSVIGAGSVVVKTIEENVVAFGSPCRVQREREKGESYLSPRSRR